MPLWTYLNPPNFAPSDEATDSGWRDASTGEIHVAIRQLVEKQGVLDFDAIKLEDGFYFLLENGTDKLILE